MNLDMTKGSPLKLILKFLVPVLLGCVFQQLYNMVDTIIVGKGVGSDALAAVGATGTIVFFILGFMNGLTTGFTVLSSQRYGAGDYEGLRKSVGNAFVLGLIVTVIMTIASLLGMDWLLRIMQTPEDIFDMSKEYIVIICVGIIFTTLYNLTASILRAVGNSKVPLYFLILSALLNVVLDLFFIMVLSWGVAGAAIATVISQGVSGILCLVFLLTKVDILKLKKEHWYSNGSPIFYHCNRNYDFTGSIEFAWLYSSCFLYSSLQGRAACDSGISGNGHDNGNIQCTKLGHTFY